MNSYCLSIYHIIFPIYFINLLLESNNSIEITPMYISLKTILFIFVFFGNNKLSEGVRRSLFLNLNIGETLPFFKDNLSENTPEISLNHSIFDK